MRGWMVPVGFFTDRGVVAAKAGAAGREDPIAGVLVLKDEEEASHGPL
jgi:hypothetical protein